jgi:DNA-binding LytR/AlgR family response regulator
MKTIKTVIIEDEAPAFRRLQKLLDNQEVDIEITEVLDSVKASVSFFQHAPDIDLIFMDIQLSDGLSFEIFEQVEINKPIIFTTAFDEYTLKAFKVNSIDYLLKPIVPEDLDHSLNKFFTLTGTEQKQIDWNQIIEQISNPKSFKDRFLIKQGDSLVPMMVETIAYFYTRYGGVRLCDWQGNEFNMDFTLDELQEMLNPDQFFRFNRQYLGALNAIKKVEKGSNGKLILDLVPATKETVKVSAERASDFKTWLGG